jgi:hypothetical protein
MEIRRRYREYSGARKLKIAMTKAASIAITRNEEVLISITPTRDVAMTIEAIQKSLWFESI